MTVRIELLRPDDLLGLDVELDTLRLDASDPVLIGGPSTATGTTLDEG